jgi:acetyl-CoA carboxylase biotin carboxyl carrier protein
MTYKEVQELITLINKSNLTEFKMEKADFKISIRTKKYNKPGKIRMVPQSQMVSMPVAQHVPAASAAAAPAEAQGKGAAPAPVAASAEPSKNLIEIKSPIVGTFYRSSSPDKEVFVKVGDVVGKGNVVCIVEAMKLFNEIESEVSGRIVKVLVENAQPVQYDQPLFLVDPAG